MSKKKKLKPDGCLCIRGWTARTKLGRKPLLIRYCAYSREGVRDKMMAIDALDCTIVPVIIADARRYKVVPISPKSKRAKR